MSHTQKTIRQSDHFWESYSKGAKHNGDNELLWKRKNDPKMALFGLVGLAFPSVTRSFFDENSKFQKWVGVHCHTIPTDISKKFYPPKWPRKSWSYEKKVWKMCITELPSASQPVSTWWNFTPLGEIWKLKLKIENFDELVPRSIKIFNFHVQFSHFT